MQDAKTDLAIIRIDSKQEFTALKFSNDTIRSKIKIGKFVIAI
jgi:S1-C subfamily serine protease